MKKGFTIVEVSILFVIFLIVAFLVAPLSLDDTARENNIRRWRNVQSEFSNVFYSINLKKENADFNLNKTFEETIKVEIKNKMDPYKITYKNGTFPSSTYRFTEFWQTVGNATIAYKLYNDTQNPLKGLLMYDVNGSMGPNIWGKDVFGLNIYNDRFEPFCKNNSLAEQKQDCADSGTGLCCSNYYINGGFD